MRKIKASIAAALVLACAGSATLYAQATSPAPAATAEKPAPTPVATILFAPGSATLPFEATSGLEALATAMTGGTARVEVHGYAGAPGDLSSDARRLSLRRCLAVREYLTSRGIARERVALRPLGGAAEGPADRADIIHVRR